MKILVLFWVIVFICPVVSIFGDTVILKNGTVVKGKINSIDNNQITITEKSGKAQKISKSDSIKILYKEANEKEIQEILKEYNASEEAKNENSDSKNAVKNPNTFLRLSADLFLGNYISDWEDRLRFMNLLNGRLESEWSGKLGPGLRLGGEYYQKIENSPITHFFVGMDISHLERSYSSKAVGFTFANGKANAELDIIKLHTGFVWDLQPNFRLKPKLNIFRIQELVDVKSNHIGLFNGIGTIGTGENKITNHGTTSTLSLGLEFDVQKDFSISSEIHLLSPFLYEDSGSYTSKSRGYSVLASPAVGMQMGNSKGKYQTSVSGVSVGFHKQISSTMKLYGIYEKMGIESRVVQPVAGNLSILSLEGGGASTFDVIFATAYQAVFFGEKQTIELHGIKLGVSVDIDL